MSKLKVFFDGNCVLCDKEIKHYIKKDKAGLLIPINIMDEDFDATQYGLDPNLVHLHIYAIDEEGTIYSKVDTFIEIWKRIPSFNFAAKVASNSCMKWLLDKGYLVFAKYIRPKLPKKDCSSGACEI